MPRRAWTSRLRSLPVVVLLFLVTLPAVTTRFYASDEVEFYAWLRSVAFDRDADFDNEYRHFYDAGAMRDPGFLTTFLEETNEAGRRRNFTPIGTALLWTPFFALGHLAANMSGAPVDGFSQPYVTAVAWGSACYGFLALLLTHAIVKRVIGEGRGSALVVWLGTPLLFYMYVAPGFSHACSAFAVSLFIWTWLRIRGRWTRGGAAALGVTAALMAMVREQDAFFVVGPAIDFCRAAIAPAALARPRTTVSRMQMLGIAATGAIVALLTYLPQLAAYRALNGHPGPTRDVARKMSWTSPHFFEVLFSLEHGLFLWTPLAIASLAGLVWMAARRPLGTRPDVRGIGIIAVIMFAMQVYVSGSVESWTVAGSFGQRRFVALTPLLALGLAALAEAIHVRSNSVFRWAWGGAIVLGIWWNIGLMAQFGLHTMDRQRLSIGQNARVTFLELPVQLPSIVLRYFLDRASFYAQPRQAP
jgi:hypothetical protein